MFCQNDEQSRARSSVVCINCIILVYLDKDNRKLYYKIIGNDLAFIAIQCFPHKTKRELNVFFCYHHHKFA